MNRRTRRAHERFVKKFSKMVKTLETRTVKGSASDEPLPQGMPFAFHYGNTPGSDPPPSENRK
jgi:hypothetical protein